MADAAIVSKLAKAAKSYTKDVVALVAAGSTTEATYYPAVKSLIAAALTVEDLPFDVGLSARVYAGRGCGGTSITGCRLHASVIPIRSIGLASSPEVGAGCGKAARPDLWRGCSVMSVSTPTLECVAGCGMIRDSHAGWSLQLGGQGRSRVHSMRAVRLRFRPAHLRF